MSSGENDSLHCIHGSPIVEKPQVSRESRLNSDESSRGVKLSSKASDSILIFSGICASRPLPAAQNFPKAIPTTTATDSQISSMNIMFNASPLIFHREKDAMNMPNHREESEILGKTPIGTAHTVINRWGYHWENGIR